MTASQRLLSVRHLIKQLLLPKYVRTYYEGRTENVTFRENEDILDLNIHGEILKFPYVWLRDNCQCAECFHPTAKSRVVDWAKFNLDSKPKDVIKDENSLQVTWDDGHESRYKINWLKLRSFTDKHRKNYNDTIFKPTKKTWHGNNFQKILSKHEFSGIINDDKQLFKWIHDLSVYGVALIKNTPNKETALDSVVQKIGFPKKTHYGTNFIVQNVPNTSNVAYLNSNLQIHVDLPYYEYCPGVNMLHCLVQTSSRGGENLLSDGHYTAEYIKTYHPEQFKLLTDIDVEWSDIGTEQGNEFFKLHRAPVICLDKHGQIERINFSIPQRGSHFLGPIEVVKPWYKAHSLFFKLNMDFAAKFKTDAGDILVFDNIRLLHGRNQYEDKPNNVRKLIGAYVDWDEIYSRLRCLQLKYNHNDELV
ncbi:gamma-butyrobetaine dioxygenase-like [Aricia agestis]|uniref:gamma-butyrobetaine dioxygenase-like n=1 Tax=Aricia agestis TaxID=91739 RepID=UPI001C20507D|nr:gamma-butyrobetaine dioxygenase-like [Aricia agestis]